MSQIDVKRLDAGFFTASGRCEECGLGFSSGGDSPFAAESGTRYRIRQHGAEAHGILDEEDAADAEDGDAELGAE